MAELIAFDFDEQIKKILKQHDIMRNDFDEFKALQKEIAEVQSVWEEQMKIFRDGIANSMKNTVTKDGQGIN